MRKSTNVHTQAKKPALELVCQDGNAKRTIRLAVTEDKAAQALANIRPSWKILSIKAVT